MTATTEQILHTLNRIGGRVSERELAYQLRRAGLDVSDRALLDLLAQLEGEGHVQSTLSFELAAGTSGGRA